MFRFDKYTMSRQCIFLGKVAWSGCTLHIELKPFCSSLSFLNFLSNLVFFSIIFSFFGGIFSQNETLEMLFVPFLKCIEEEKGLGTESDALKNEFIIASISSKLNVSRTITCWELSAKKARKWAQHSVWMHFVGGRRERVKSAPEVLHFFMPFHSWFYRWHFLSHK